MFTILLNEFEYQQAYRILQGSTINVFFTPQNSNAVFRPAIVRCQKLQPTHLFKWDHSGLWHKNTG